MRRNEKIPVEVYVYASRQNGVVLNVNGVCPCLGVGCHSGVEPKVMMIHETA